MNIEEAMNAAMLGDRVTHASFGRDTFVSYDFGTVAGYKAKHMKRFGEWASCTFIASDDDFAADWYVETREICGECFGFKASQCRCERQTRWHGNDAVPAPKSAWAGVGDATPHPSHNKPIVLTKAPTIIGEVPPKPNAWAGVKVEPPKSDLERWGDVIATQGAKRDSWGRIID